MITIYEVWQQLNEDIDHSTGLCDVVLMCICVTLRRLHLDGRTDGRTGGWMDGLCVRARILVFIRLVFLSMLNWKR